MSQMKPEPAQAPVLPAWKSQMYLMGAIIGGILGFLSAYMFAREAEDANETDERPEVPPTVLLGLALSMISLVRQIAETGRKPANSKKK